VVFKFNPNALLQLELAGAAVMLEKVTTWASSVLPLNAILTVLGVDPLQVTEDPKLYSPHMLASSALLKSTLVQLSRKIAANVPEYCCVWIPSPIWFSPQMLEDESTAEEVRRMANNDSAERVSFMLRRGQ